MKRLTVALTLLASTLACAQEYSEQDGSAAVARAFKVFWASTDCNELRSLSQWPELIAKMGSNDKELCENLVGLHQFVRQVDINEVQLLTDNKARVKATITLISEASMKQEETFALIKGKWLLTPH